MGKKDKKSRDPLKKAALAAKKEAKADKAALKRLQKEQDRLNSLSIQDSDHHDGKQHQQQPQEESLDSILASFRQRTKELETAVLEPIERRSLVHHEVTLHLHCVLQTDCFIW